MKNLMLIAILMTSVSTFAKWSPKIITYKKSFDEIKTLSFDQEMFYSDFKVIKEDFFKLDAWMCTKTLEIKEQGSKTINASGNTLTLVSATVTTPYTHCHGLPNFATISNPKLKNLEQHTIRLIYNDEDSNEVSISLYGKNRARLYFEDFKYSGKITETY